MRGGALLSHLRCYSSVMLCYVCFVLGCVASACSLFQLLFIEGFVTTPAGVSAEEISAEEISSAEPRRPEPRWEEIPFRRQQQQPRHEQVSKGQHQQQQHN